MFLLVLIMKVIRHSSILNIDTVKELIKDFIKLNSKAPQI